MMMNKEKTVFVPTAQMLSAAENVVSAMAWLETVKPVVLAYQTKILADNKWPYANEWVGRGLHDPGDVVTDPKDSYLLDEEHSLRYFAECHSARDAAGLTVDGHDKCPLLVAENLVRKAQQALIDTMEPVTQLSYTMLSTSADCVANIKKVVDLTRKLLVPHITKTPSSN